MLIGDGSSIAPLCLSTLVLAWYVTTHWTTLPQQLHGTVHFCVACGDDNVPGVSQQGGDAVFDGQSR